MDKKIRRAVIKDTDEIISLLSDSAKLHANHRGDIIRNSTLHYSENDIHNLFIEDGPINAFVSINEAEKITGILLYRIGVTSNHNVFLDSKKMWIDEICIGEPYRKQGYGKILLDYAKETAQSNNCSRIELNVWAFNKNAYDFYVNQGMKEQRVIMEYIF